MAGITENGAEDGEAAFDAWIERLRVDVVQGEYGYEPGEFAVYPDLWRRAYDEGLTPQEAFRRALSEADAERALRDARRREHRARIDAAEAAPPGT